jgi:3-phenylpropionate/trans-cinnamate dioxygenase ferredoxin reductase subunit
VNAQDLAGQKVQIAGPSGTFWLPEGAGSIVLVAVGSGLAPVLALLEDALRAGIKRPTTLIFGARQKHYLYALDRIARLSAESPAFFRFVPVLSALKPLDVWLSERGNVTDLIPKYLGDADTAYLCGPRRWWTRRPKC